MLRAHTIADFPESARMWAEPQVVLHIGGQPSSAQASWMRVLRYAGMWPLLGYGYWAIEHRETGEFAGEVGFADFKREIEPPLGEVPELGWALASRFHGRGYGTEAVRAALAWSDAYLDAAETVCLIDPANRGSHRVAQKCGFRESHRARFMGGETVVYRRARVTR